MLNYFDYFGTIVITYTSLLLLNLDKEKIKENLSKENQCIADIKQKTIDLMGWPDCKIVDLNVSDSGEIIFKVSCPDENGRTYEVIARINNLKKSITLGQDSTFNVRKHKSKGKCIGKYCEMGNAKIKILSRNPIKRCANLLDIFTEAKKAKKDDGNSKKDEPVQTHSTSIQQEDPKLRFEEMMKNPFRSTEEYIANMNNKIAEAEVKMEMWKLQYQRMQEDLKSAEKLKENALHQWVLMKAKANMPQTNARLSEWLEQKAVEVDIEINSHRTRIYKIKQEIENLVASMYVEYPIDL